jgi:5-(carboxyamino)imidazole ribonucleotide mutase
MEAVKGGTLVSLPSDVDALLKEKNPNRSPVDWSLHFGASLDGVIAALTPLPVIGLPIDSTLQGQDALLSIVQMPPGIPVATVGINAGLNAAILAVRMLSLSDEALAGRYASYCASLSKKIVKANADLAAISDYKYKV